MQTEATDTGTKQQGSTAETLTEQLNNNIFQPVYYFCGNESFLKFFYTDKIVGMFLPDEARDDCTYKYEGENLTTEEFESTAMSFSMLSDKKAIIIRDLPLNGAVCEYCIKHPEVFGKDTVIIIHDSKDKPDEKSENGKRFIDLIKDKGMFLQINHLDEATLKKWIKKQCRLCGMEAEDRDITYLYENVGKDMFTLQNEIKKIGNYTDSGRLRAADIDALCSSSAEIRGYLITSAVVDADSATAFKLTEEFLKSKDGNEQILAATIFNYIAKLWKVKLMYSAGISDGEIAKAIEVKNAFAYIRFAKNHTEEYIDKMVEVCVKADLSLKSTSTPANAVLYRLIAELIALT